MKKRKQKQVFGYIFIKLIFISNMII